MLTLPSSDSRLWSCGLSLIRRTAGCGPACPVVWQGRRGDPSPYADCSRLEVSRLGRSLSLIPQVSHLVVRPLDTQALPLHDGLHRLWQVSAESLVVRVFGLVLAGLD